MVVFELFNDVKIDLQEHPVDARHQVMSYTATIEIDDQMCTVNHISEAQAKEKVCENYLRTMLTKKLSGRSAENASRRSKSKGPLEEDFPWVYFVSLAMDYLINQWELDADFIKANYVQEKSQSNTGEKINNNARISRLVTPKSPLMVLNELFNRVPINIQDNRCHNVGNYTATIENNGKIYSGSHISKIQAKQKACENFLRSILEKELSERSAENASKRSKSKGPPEEDFPWLYFASLAMYFLLNQWELQNC